MRSLSAKKGPSDAQLELRLREDIFGFHNSPLGFVLYAFPWGEGALAEEDGPDTWQQELLEELGRQLEANDSVEDVLRKAIQIAVSSGHGVGKTAFVAWLILWFMSTRHDPQLVVTANTKTQLTTKTWRELAKWHKLAINGHWFKWMATRFEHVDHPETWFASAIPWSEHNSEAFAGTHEKYVLLIFDEASAIADKIWEVAEGATTTTGTIWMCFGNPTQNTGRFAECWGKFKHRWTTRQVDSRTAKKANRAKIQQWIDDYGEDHDFVRVRVRGVFPRAGSLQLISLETVRLAMAREAVGYDGFAKIMGLDVARHGDDQSARCNRQGNKTWPIQAYRIADTMKLADQFAHDIEEFEPDAVFIDATGIGWGVYDRLQQLGFRMVIPVQTGESANNDRKYKNKRMELWYTGKTWLEEGGCLPQDNELEMDLISPEYGYDTNFLMTLEKKEDMKDRGLASPDKADAFMLTFASPVLPKRDRGRMQLDAPPSDWRTI